MEKELFHLVHLLFNKGNDLTDKYHIIDMEEEVNQDDFSYLKKSYRVYHSEGYCFDISLVGDIESKEKYYILYSEWEGFKKIKNSEHAICLIK